MGQWLVLRVFHLLLSFAGFHAYYMELDPFLSHTTKCYNHLINFKPTGGLDLTWTEYPVAISTLDYKDKKEERSCKPNRENIGTLDNTKEGICKTVWNNFSQKQVLCLAVTLIYSRGTEDTERAYEYIMKSWSNLLWQDRRVMVSNDGGTAEYAGIFKMNLFPSRIYITALASHRLKVYELSPMARFMKSFQSFQKLFGEEVPNPSSSVKEFLSHCFGNIPIIICMLTNITNSIGDTELVEDRAFLSLEPMRIGVITPIPLEKGLSQRNIEETHKKLFRDTVKLFVAPKSRTEDLKFVHALAEILTRSFNQSQIFNETTKLNPNGTEFLVFVKYNALNKVYVGDSTQVFQAVRQIGQSVITCSGLTRDVGFSDYVQPFQYNLWATCIGFFGISVTVTTYLLRGQGRLESIWLIVISYLLEHSLVISSQVEANAKFRYVFISFLLATIVLSNGYKGVVVTSLVRPYGMTGIDSLDYAVGSGFTLYYQLSGMHYDTDTHAVCCLNSVGELSPGCKDKVVVQSLVNSTYSFIYMGWGMFDTRRRVQLLKALKTAEGRIWDIKENAFNFTSSAEVRLVRLLKGLVPPPCSSNVMSKILECNNSLYILPNYESEDQLFQARLDPDNFKGLYDLNDKSFVLPNNILGFNIYFVQFLTNFFRPLARDFVEFGLYGQILSQDSYNRKLGIVTRARQTPGWSHQIIGGYKSLNLDTRIGTSFLAYLICGGLAVICFIAEVKPSPFNTPCYTIWCQVGCNCKLITNERRTKVEKYQSSQFQKEQQS